MAAARLVDEWLASDGIEGEPLVHGLRDYSFGIAANIAVGLNLTAAEVREGRQHLDSLIEGMFSSRLADLGRRKRAAKLARQRLDSLLEDHLDPIAKSIASGGATARGYGARRTLLEEMISAARAGGIPYSGGKWLYDLVVTVLFGCTLTAADSMASALESLAGAPDVLADLRSEHLGLRAADMVGPWGLSKMPVTDAVVREVFRLNTPTAHSPRRALKEVPELGGKFSLPESMREGGGASASDNFAPERWLQQEPSEAEVCVVNLPAASVDDLENLEAKLRPRLLQVGLSEYAPPVKVDFVCRSGKSYSEQEIDEAYPDGLESFGKDMFPMLIVMSFKKERPQERQKASVASKGELPNLNILSRNTPELQGIYALESAQSPNGYPVWKHEGKDWWLYNSPNDFWGIGGEAVKIENFKCNKGRIVATKAASGLMPWDMREWRYSDGAQWYLDNSIKMDVLQDMLCQDASIPVGFVPAKGAQCAVRFPAGRDVAEIQMKLLLGELARRAEWRIGVPASHSKGGALARRMAMRIHVTPVDRRLLSS
jgi:hypothetical protein